MNKMSCAQRPRSSEGKVNRTHNTKAKFKKSNLLSEILNVFMSTCGSPVNEKTFLVGGGGGRVKQRSLITPISSICNSRYLKFYDIQKQQPESSYQVYPNTPLN